MRNFSRTNRLTDNQIYGLVMREIDEYLDNAQRAPNIQTEQSSQKTEQEIIVAALKNYRIPPREIREKYKSEFEIWFKEWCSIDQNRKFLLHSARKNFCREKLNIKLAN